MTYLIAVSCISHAKVFYDVSDTSFHRNQLITVLSV